MIEKMAKTQVGYKRYPGESTLEATIALIAAVILLLGITQVFVWVNKTMVKRHQAYQATRFNENPPVEFYTPEQLNMFGE